MQRRTAHALLATASAVFFTGCALSPPAAPVPNESRRVPANDRRELALISCTTDLAAAKTSVVEMHRLVDRSTAVAGELQVENAALARMAAAPKPSPVSPAMGLAVLPNRIFVAFHRTNSPAPELPEEQAAELLAAARTAAYIEIRGRTDGQADTPAESRIARQRAEFMRDWLVKAGVRPSRIAATWQPVGDHLGPNDSPEGRALNRRVEVEVYAVAPVHVNRSKPTGALSGAAAAAAAAQEDVVIGPVYVATGG